SLCNNGDLGACEVAGLGYISGKSVSQDYDRAAVLLEPACQAKRPLGCGGMAKLGQVGKVELSPTEIVKGLEGACGAKDADSCQRLGQVLAKGEGVAKDEARANKLFEGACAEGSQEGCFHQALRLRDGGVGITPNPTKAARLMTTACSAKVGAACY